MLISLSFSLHLHRPYGEAFSKSRKPFTRSVNTPIQKQISDKGNYKNYSKLKLLNLLPEPHNLNHLLHTKDILRNSAYSRESLALPACPNPTPLQRSRNVLLRSLPLRRKRGQLDLRARRCIALRVRWAKRSMNPW